MEPVAECISDGCFALVLNAFGVAAGGIDRLLCALVVAAAVASRLRAC
jgi:hypothetical protein